MKRELEWVETTLEVEENANDIYKMTVEEFVEYVIEENRPFDYKWLKRIKRTYTDKQKREWAKNILECFAFGTESKQFLGQATTLFIDEVMSEVWD